jgi:ArsR family transcriptional regulator
MDPDQFTRISRALADPRRMEILQRIAAEPEVGCASLTCECTVSQPTISHHLKELTNAGLIKTRREAKFAYYMLDGKVWSDYLEEMRRRIPINPERG